MENSMSRDKEIEKFIVNYEEIEKDLEEIAEMIKAVYPDFRVGKPEWEEEGFILDIHFEYLNTIEIFLQPYFDSDYYMRMNIYSFLKYKEPSKKRLWFGPYRLDNTKSVDRDLIKFLINNSRYIGK